MDRKLIAWARAVKAKAPRNAPPPLWLFTDEQRAPDPIPDITRLPRGLCGVVLRHDGLPPRDRQALIRQVAGLCRARRLSLSIAGPARLALAAGASPHRRQGFLAGRGDRITLPSLRPAQGPNRRMATASAHTAAELRRAVRLKASLIFLSPFQPTTSHPGAPGLGAARWARIARAITPDAPPEIAVPPARTAALGGINGRTAPLLRLCGARHAGAIGAFLAASKPRVRA